MAVEREVNGLSAAARLDVRLQRVAPLVHDLQGWMRAERAGMSKHNPVAKAINYMLDGEGRWEAFTAFLDDGRLCLTNNAAERALRGIALGRKSWLFAGSERGGDRAAFMYTLIVTAKMNDIDPQAWMADVLARMPDLPVSRLPELLPWKWKATASPPRGLHGRLQLRPTVEDTRRPHATRIHLQNLDIIAGTIHPRSDPPGAGTEHLIGSLYPRCLRSARGNLRRVMRKNPLIRTNLATGLMPTDCQLTQR